MVEPKWKGANNLGMGSIAFLFVLGPHSTTCRVTVAIQFYWRSLVQAHNKEG